MTTYAELCAGYGGLELLPDGQFLITLQVSYQSTEPERER